MTYTRWATRQFGQRVLSPTVCAAAVLHALVAVGVAEPVPIGFVSNTLSESVSVINLAQNTVLDTVAVGAMPRGITLSRDRRFAFVATVAPDGVAVIDTASLNVVRTITDVGSFPQA